MAMGMLPADQWGVVVKNYTDLYPNIQKYTDQLRALEAARNSKPSEPALRFLLGFQYYYLGYSQEAVRELEKTLQLAPQDPVAQELLGVITGKSPATSSGAPATLPAPLPSS